MKKGFDKDAVILKEHNIEGLKCIIASWSILFIRHSQVVRRAVDQSVIGGSWLLAVGCLSF